MPHGAPKTATRFKFDGYVLTGENNHQVSFNLSIIMIQPPVMSATDYQPYSEHKEI